MYTKLIAAAVLVVAILGSYWATYSAGKRHEKMAQVVALAEANEIASKNYDTLFELYLAEQNKKKTVTKVIREEVEKIVEKPIYKVICIDEEGMNKANEAIMGKKP